MVKESAPLLETRGRAVALPWLVVGLRRSKGKVSNPSVSHRKCLTKKAVGEGLDC